MQQVATVMSKEVSEQTVLLKVKIILWIHPEAHLSPVFMDLIALQNT